MKKLLFSLLFFLSFLVKGQSPVFQKLLDEGKVFEKKGDYKHAIKKYNAAAILDKKNAAIAQKRIENVFDAIQKLKENAVIDKEKAVKSEKKALKAQEVTEVALLNLDEANKITKQALDSVQNIFSMFKFYDNKFAFVLNRSKQWQVYDKRQHKIRADLGEWDLGQAFDDEIGYAMVGNGGTSAKKMTYYLLDTLGNAYEMAFSDSKEVPTTAVAFDLRDEYMNEFPSELFKRTTTKILLLGNNKIQKLPDSIGNLIHIEVLNLANNKIDTVSPSIGKMTQLRILNFQGNKLTKLPDGITQLYYLENLNLKDNQLSHLPFSEKSFLNLRFLDLSANKILPSEWSKITFLANERRIVKFTLSDSVQKQEQVLWVKIDIEQAAILFEQKSKFDNANVYFDEIKKIKSLEMQNGRYTAIPNYVTELSVLEQLNLADNRFKNLPDSLPKLSALTQLFLNFNPNIDWQQATGILAKMSQNVRYTLGRAQLKSEKNTLWVYIDQAQVWDVLKYAAKNQISELKEEKSLFFNILVDTLKVLPDEITAFENLEELRLQENALTSLPNAIGNLPFLRILNLSGNPLQKLPTNFAALQNLRYLFLRKTKNLDWSQTLPVLNAMKQQIAFTTSGYWLENNPNVVWVYVDEAAISDLLRLAKPEQLTEFLTKTNVNLYEQNLAQFPSYLFGMKKIEQINLHTNNISSLPTEIGSLPNLSELILRGNKISELPNEISALNKLTLLDLGLNPLQKLPNSFANLTNLRMLKLNACANLDFGNLFSVLSKFNKKIILTDDVYAFNDDQNYLLVIADVKQKHFDNNFALLKNVSKILLNTANLTTIPSVVFGLENLEVLELSENQIREVPKEIGNLINLTHFSLNVNQVKTLPNEIAKLKKLSYLGLIGNLFTEIPMQIQALEKLETLGIGDNPITNFPPSFFTWRISNTIDYGYWVEGAAKSKNFGLAQQVFEGIKNKTELNYTNYQNLAWWFIQSEVFEGAIWSGLRGRAQGITEIGAESNIALGYLYNGEIDKAMEIIRKYENEKNNLDFGRTGRDIFRKDLEDLGEAKVRAKNPEMVKQVIDYLKK